MTTACLPESGGEVDVSKVVATQDAVLTVDGGKVDGFVPKPARKSLAKATVKVVGSPLSYTGKALKPAVRVTLSGKALKAGRDYRVSYSSNRLPGIAKVTVTGAGAYAGSRSASFKIGLSAAKVKSAKPGRRSVTVKWTRQRRGAVGYQVRCSPRKSMRGAKVSRVAKNARTSLTVRRLKSGKRYYVQVRTFKKLGKKTYVSAWSAKRSAIAR